MKWSDGEIDPRWMEAVPVFLAAARSGSATSAGAVLGLAPATVLRQIAALEEALGVRLFDRTSGGLRRTPAAELALPWAERMEAAGHALRRELHGLESQPEGVVRLALLPAVSSLFIVPTVPALRAQHPGLALELLPASAVLDLDRREADLALRLVRPEHGDLVARRLADVPLVFVAAPALLERVQPTRLADLPWVDWEPSVGAAEARLLGQLVPEGRVVLRSTEMVSLLAAAQAGVGALLCGEPLAARVGGLVRIPLTSPSLPPAALWLVTHRALRDVPRVAAVWTWLVSSFAAASSAGELSLP